MIEEGIRKHGEIFFPYKILLLLSSFFVLTMTWFASVPQIGGSAEAREAQVVDEVVREHVYILPLRNGLIPSKPPFFHWVAAATSYAVGGVSEFSVRIPSVVFSLATLWLVAFSSFRLAALTRASPGSYRPDLVALLSFAILSLTYGFYVMGCIAVVDMSFTFFVTAALAAPFITTPVQWSECRSLSTLSRTMFWFLCAGGVLARGPVGLVLPLVLVAGGAWYVLGLKKTIREMLTPSMGWFFFLVPGAWYFAAFARGGGAFLQRQLVFENLKRVVGGEHVNSEIWWFYLPSLLRTAFPWSSILIFLFLLRVRRTEDEKWYFAAPTRAFIAPVISLLCGVLLFSLPSGKRHSYMLPLYSLIAVQLALMVTEALENGTSHFRGRALKSLDYSLLFAAVLSLTALFVLGVLQQSWSWQNGIWAGIRPTLLVLSFPVGAVILLSLTPFFLAKSDDPATRARSVWFVCFGLMSSVVCVGTTIKAALKSFPALTQSVVENIREGQSLVVIKDRFDEYFDPILFYLRKRVTIVDIDQQILPCSRNETYLIHRMQLPSIESRLHGHLEILNVLREFGDSSSPSYNRDILLYQCSPIEDDFEKQQKQIDGFDPLKSV